MRVLLVRLGLGLGRRAEGGEAVALVAVDDKEGPGRDKILGVARIIADPEGERAEFAVMVRSDMKGRGLGFQLMKDLLASARAILTTKTADRGGLVDELTPPRARR